MSSQVRDRTHKVATMSFTFICTYNFDANDCPTCRSRAATLAESLKLDLDCTANTFLESKYAVLRKYVISSTYVSIEHKSGIVQSEERHRCHWMDIRWSLSQDINIYQRVVTFLLKFMKLWPQIIIIGIYMLTPTST